MLTDEQRGKTCRKSGRKISSSFFANKSRCTEKEYVSEHLSASVERSCISNLLSHPVTEYRHQAGAGIAQLVVGPDVLLDAVSWVRSSSEEIFSGRGDFSIGVNMGSDSIPPKLFRMRVQTKV